MSARRGLQMLLLMVDVLPSLPILVSSLRTFIPIVMPDVLMVVVLVRERLRIGRGCYDR